MKFRIFAVLCAALTLWPGAASAIKGTTAIVAILALKTQAGEPVANGKTDDTGRWVYKGLLPAGSYTLQVGKIPAMMSEKMASITISIGGQQVVIRTTKGLMFDKEGGREMIYTVPIPNAPTEYAVSVGSPMTPSDPRTFSVTIMTVPPAEAP